MVLFLFLNNIQNDSFSELIDSVLKYYPDRYNSRIIQNILFLIKSLDQQYTNESSELIFRELKDLINKSFYNRLTNKIKTELVNEGLLSEKADLLFLLLSNYSDKYSIKDEYTLSKAENKINDFEIITQMPILKTNSIMRDSLNKDIKQQELLLKLDLGKDDITQISMNKKMSSKLFEEIEKLQEALDKLY